MNSNAYLSAEGLQRKMPLMQQPFLHRTVWMVFTAMESIDQRRKALAGCK